jgi:hypothetical protein
MKKILAIGAGLLVAHIILKEQRKKEPTVRYVDKLPFNASYNALALPPFGIYIKNEHINNVALLSHELTHWKQYQRKGLIPFYVGYLKEYVTVGYDQSPMEKEARTAAGENEYCINNYTECIRNGTAKTAFNPTFRK